ncbi:MAG: NAD(P)-dependent oxidoreductase [Euryarchaeota archaeon]|nr:NAD(P)-dependent oxidoreductase [Euryarchaeota archaeon]
MDLVTGGAGYLGSHLARHLMEKKREVRIFDIQKTKYLPEGAEFTQGDLRDPQALAGALRGVDTVFHLAFVQSLSKLPEKTRWDINIGGMDNILKESTRAGVRRFVHTSTIEIYGTRPPQPCTEEAPTDHPVGWYGLHKLESEKRLWAYCKETGLEAAAVRMPTICGPGYYNHRPILDLMDRVLQGGIVPLMNRGETRGDFVYYKDVLQGYHLCAEKPGAVGQAFNISTDRSSTQKEIVESLIRAAGSKSRIVYVPGNRTTGRLLMAVTGALGFHRLPRYQWDYVFYHNTYSVEKAKRLLGYKPTKSAAEAAAELIQEYAKDREFVRRRSENY